MKRLIGIFFFLCVFSSPVFAVCPATLQLKDNAGVTPTAKYTDDGSGNCMANVAIQDGGSITTGAKADAAWVSGSGSIISILKNIAGGIAGAIPTGSNTIGKVNILGNAGAAVDGATGAAPPANVLYFGANASGATGGQLRGLINCDKHGFVHITSATDTLAVQGVASQTIFICGWRSRAAGVATWFFENTASANANCSSSNTQIAGVATEAANTGEIFAPPFWMGLKNTSGNGLCINSTGTGGVDVDFFYAQF